MAPHVWTCEAVIAALQADAVRLGRPPKLNEWRNASPHHPSATTVRDRFGSWNHALTAAGLPTRKIGMPTVWDRGRVKQAIYHAAYKLKRVPTAADMKRLSRMFPAEFPSVATVIYHMGSWNEGLIAVGYVPHRRTRRRRAPQRCPRCDSQHWGFQECSTERIAA